MKECYYSKYEPVFGAWQIVAEIGSGAEGHLYRIQREDSLGHEYFSALKAISIPSGGEAELLSLMAGGLSRNEAEDYFENALKTTLQEFDLIARLKGNSNIVSYEDHEIYRRTEDFGWDILIRIEELTPLVQYSAEHALSPEDVTKMGADICRGLTLCRRFNIIHRDIKPENIFIAPSGDYKLGDFGIARVLEHTQKALSRKGTYTYMAPEVYWGREYGPSIDLYSLGLVMYRYLNDGREPFMPDPPAPVLAENRESAFLRRICDPEIPAPRNGSPALKAIVLKACALDREERYQDAAEMLHDLEALRFSQDASNYLAPAQASAAISTAVTNDTPSGSAGRWKIPAVLLAVILLIAGAIYAAIPKAVTNIGGLDPETEIYIGDSLAPEYTVEPDRFKDEPILFQSANEEICSVDADGRLQAVSTGETTVTMTAREYTQEVHVTVVPKVTGIKGIEDPIVMTEGDTLTLQPVLQPERFASEPVSFSVEDSAVAAVSADGILTAAAPGKTTLTLRSGGYAMTVQVQVEERYVPPVYNYSGGSGNSSGKKKSSDEGYFNSGDDEYF